MLKLDFKLNFFFQRDVRVADPDDPAAFFLFDEGMVVTGRPEDGRVFVANEDVFTDLGLPEYPHLQRFAMR